MNKKETIERIALTTLRSEGTIQLFYEVLETLITETLIEKNESFRLSHKFGTFVVKTRKAYQTYHPKTREPIQVPEQRVIRFKPAKALKKLLKNQL